MPQAAQRRPLSIDAVLAQLQGVREHGGGWMACCPAHEDSTPSLSIATGRDGAALLKCFAGCDYKEITRALFPPQVTRTFKYDDGAGTIVAEIDRIEDGAGKLFLPYRVVDGRRNATPGLARITLPLYRRAELLATCSRGGTVYVTEGEGKADDLLAALRDVGRDASVTTVAGGAAKSLTDALASDFAGAGRVVVLGDNDDAGKDAARKRAAMIAKHADVRVVEALPGVGAKGDVADFLRNGGSIELLEAIVEQQASFRESGAQMLSHADLLALDIPPVQFYIETLLEAENAPALITGPPASYKSLVARSIAASLATGRKLFGEFAILKRPPKVIFLNLDAGRISFLRCMRQLAAEPMPNLFALHWDTWDQEAFAALLKDNAGAFVVIDCFSTIFRVPERGAESDATRDFIDSLRKVYAEHGCGGLLIDHTPRQSGNRSRDPRESYYGSVQKQAAIRQGMTLQRVDNEGGATPRISVSCMKMSEAAEFAPFVLEATIVDGFPTLKYVGTKEKDDAAAVRAQAETVVEYLRGKGRVPSGRLEEDVMALGVPRRALRNLLKVDQRIVPIKEGRFRWYSLDEPTAY